MCSFYKFKFVIFIINSLYITQIQKKIITQIFIVKQFIAAKVVLKKELKHLNS